MVGALVVEVYLLPWCYHAPITVTPDENNQLRSSLIKHHRERENFQLCHFVTVFAVKARLSNKPFLMNLFFVDTQKISNL